MPRPIENKYISFEFEILRNVIVWVEYDFFFYFIPVFKYLNNISSISVEIYYRLYEDFRDQLFISEELPVRKTCNQYSIILLENSKTKLLKNIIYNERQKSKLLRKTGNWHSSLIFSAQ